MVRCPELDLRSRDLTCVSKKGVLSRRGRHLHNWSKRHVVIASNFIFYYKSPNDKPAGAVWLDGARATTVPAVDGRRHCFEVVTRAKRVFTFQGQNRKDVMLWVAAINAAAYARLQGRLETVQTVARDQTQRCARLAQKLQAWVSVFQSAGGAPALQEDDAPSRAKPESGQPTSPAGAVNISVIKDVVATLMELGVQPAALGANHKHTIHPHTSPTSLQGRLQASALRRSSTTSVTSRSVASSSPPPAHDSAASGGGGAASRAPGVDGAKLGVLSSPDSQHTNDSSLYITTRHEAAGQMSGHHDVGGPDGDDGANAMLLGSIKTPNYSYFKLNSPSRGVGGDTFGSEPIVGTDALARQRSTILSHVQRRQRMLASTASSGASPAAQEDEGSHHAGRDLRSRGAMAVDASRAREFSFCAAESSMSTSRSPPTAAASRLSAHSDGSDMLGKSVASMDSPDRPRVVAAVARRHLPLSRGLPVTPERIRGAAGDRSSTPGSNHGESRRASVPILRAQTVPIDTRARGRSATVRTGVHPAPSPPPPPAVPVMAVPPGTLNAARRLEGSMAAEAHVPADVAAVTPPRGAAGGRPASLRLAATPPRSPAVAALSASDSPRERRQSMSTVAKPVWELHQAHVSGSLEPEHMLHHFVQHTRSQEVDADELLLGVRVLKLAHSGGSADDHVQAVGAAADTVVNQLELDLSAKADERSSGAGASADGAAAAGSDAGGAGADAAGVDGSEVDDDGAVAHGSHPTHGSRNSSTGTIEVVEDSGSRGNLMASVHSVASRAAGGHPPASGSGASTGGEGLHAEDMSNFGRSLSASSVADEDKYLPQELQTLGDEGETLEVMHRLLLAPTAGLLHAFLQGIPHRGNDVPVALLRVFAVHGARPWLRVLRRACSAVVNSAPTVTSVFRVECMGGKLLRVFALSNGASYVHACLAAHVAALVDTQSGSPQCLLEADPARTQATRSESSDMVAHANARKLLRTAQDFLDAIIAGLPTLPASFSYVCSRLWSAAVAKFHDVSMPDPLGSADVPAPAAAAVGGFFFLRLITPALIAPSAHGLLTSTPCPRSRRSLMLVAKLLQAAVSGADLGRKEPYMGPIASEFVRTNRSRLLDAFRTLSMFPERHPTDALAECERDAASFGEGGPPLGRDLELLLGIAAHPVNVPVLLAHLPATTSTGMRRALNQLAQLEEQRLREAQHAQQRLSAGAGKHGRHRVRKGDANAPSPRTKSRHRAMVTIGSLVGGGVRFAASSRRRKPRGSSGRNRKQEPQ